jgi:carbon-monoxide dehydrogenase large subunit
MAETGTGIGAAVKRTEDVRFITGAGRYTDDIDQAGQAYAVFLRSPHARATIDGIDTAAALQVPGVVAVYTGADLAADGIGDLPCGWLVKSKDGSDMIQPPHPPLAVERVNYVGEPYGVVIADTLQAARDGAEAVVADFDDLPAVVDVATADSADQLHESVPNNQCYDWELGDKAATDAAFANADHVASLDIVNNRLIPNAMEPRAAVGDFDAASGVYTLYTTSQNPHLERLVLAAFVQVAPESKLRVVSPDVGGGFGSKIFVYAEETAVIWAAGKLRRPVKWRADRSESFLADAHGRDHVTEAELALSSDGTFLGLRVKTIANMGAYLSTFASSVPTYLYGTLMAGQYKTPAIYVEVRAMFTNTAPVDAYRGAGRPEATYVVERLVETAARELSMDPSEIRRRNFIQPEDFPYATPVALTYDTGDYEASLDKALQHIDYQGFAARRAVSEANGNRRGIGFSSYIEACGLAPSQVALSLGAGVGLFESAEVRVNVTGSVTVITGSHSHGQGHETTFAQVVSDRLGIPLEDVEVVHGDTARSDYGLGTYGSRSIAVGGSALIRATDKIIAKGKKIVAHNFETTDDNIDFTDGVFAEQESNRSMAFAEVAFAAYVPANFPLDELEPGLSEKAFYDPGNFTYPAGTHICEVEIDGETGVPTIVAFVAVDDFGNVINPMIVEGQVHGGLCQGIGQALLEHGVYDDAGQLVTGSYMDYCMPRADDVPSFTVDTTVTPCTHNPLGVKGCGEAGAIGATAAVMNAVTDALGVKSLPMPATPETVWKALRSAA